MSRCRTIVLTACMSILGIIANVKANQPPKANPKTTFALSQKTRDLIPEVRSEIMKVIVERFGDPTKPVIPDGLPVESSLIQGQKVYVDHCAKCHGVGGDGRGVDARVIQPKARDFRLGQFKWKSTLMEKKPLRHDLLETLRVGIPGTAMPSFAELSEVDAKSVVEYVRWLAMVGEFDSRVAAEFHEFSTQAVAVRLGQGEKQVDIRRDAADDVKKLLSDAAREVLQLIQEQWTTSELESQIIRPTKPTPTSAESIQRGRDLYLSPKTKCDTCHGATGKGDGPATREFWPKPGTSEKYPKPGLHDAWENSNQPWDLSIGQYRGGSGPDDLYRRIYGGISGTTMPAYGRVALTDAEIRDLVNYVRSLHPEKGDEAASKPHRSHDDRLPPALRTDDASIADHRSGWKPCVTSSSRGDEN